MEYINKMISDRNIKALKDEEKRIWEVITHYNDVLIWIIDEHQLTKYNNYIHDLKKTLDVVQKGISSII